MYYKYKARRVAIDGNGVGAGLVDFMVKSQIDPETGDYLAPFGVDNDEDNKYKKYRTADTEFDAMYIIKANAALNTEMYTFAKTQMYSGKIKFLIDETTAKNKLMTTKLGQEMGPKRRNRYLRPYIQTDILKEQIMNLTEDTEGINIILKRSSNSIKKDKFSAFLYGLFYTKQEDDRKKRRSRSGRKLVFFS